MVQYFPVVTGSLTVNGDISVSGNVVVTGSMSGTSSLATNAINAFTASTADNFIVRQALTGSSALFSGAITAQTLVVQTVTSSILYTSGSNRFGSQITDRQTFTGSMFITGSVAVFSNTICSTNIVNSNVATCTTFVQSCTGVANARLNAGTSADLFLGRCDNTNYTNILYADSTQWPSCFRWSVGMRPAGSNYQIYNEVCSNTALFVCQNNNYVGVGTNTPNELLEVFAPEIAGTSQQVRIRMAQGGSISSRVNLVAGVISGASPYFAIEARQGGSPFSIVERLRIDGSGNLGINACSLSYPLTRNGMTLKAIGADGVEFMMLSCGDTGFIGGGLVRNGVDLGLINRTGGCLIFATNATERMWLTCNGNLLIGSNIACKGLLKVAGDAEICKTMFFNGGDGNGGAIINNGAVANCATPSFNIRTMYGFNCMANYGAYMFIHTAYNTVSGKQGTVTGIVTNAATTILTITACALEAGVSAPGVYATGFFCLTFCWPNATNSNTKFIALAG